MEYKVYSKFDYNLQTAVQLLNNDVNTVIGNGWECLGGVSVSGATHKIGDNEGAPEREVLFFTASQAMVKRTAQEGGKRMPKTPTRSKSLPPPPKSRGGNRRTRKSRK